MNDEIAAPNDNISIRDILLHYIRGWQLQHIPEVHRSIAVSIAFPHGVITSMYGNCSMGKNEQPWW